MNGNSFQCDKRYFCKQIEKQIKFIIDIVGDCCTDLSRKKILVSDLFKVRIKVFQPFLELLIKQISQVKIDKIKWEFLTSSGERMSNINMLDTIIAIHSSLIPFILPQPWMEKYYWEIPAKIKNSVFQFQLTFLILIKSQFLFWKESAFKFTLQLGDFQKESYFYLLKTYQKEFIILLRNDFVPELYLQGKHYQYFYQNLNF